MVDVFQAQIRKGNSASALVSYFAFSGRSQPPSHKAIQQFHRKTHMERNQLANPERALAKLPGHCSPGWLWRHPKSQWPKQLRLYFAHPTCPSRIKRATLFIGVCLEPRLRQITDWKVKIGRVMYWVIIVLEARSDTDLFHCHFLGQYTFSRPNLIPERLG